MIPFIVVACLMSLAALSFILVPLLRKRAAGIRPVSDAGSNLAVFRSQKREIEEEFARGAISADERDTALAELSRRLVDEVPADADANAPAPANPAPSRRPWGLVAALAIVIPLAAGLMYAKLGSWSALRVDDLVAHSAPAQSAGGDATMSDKQILAMVDTLAQKMEKNPGDPKGWILLARSQSSLGRFAEAAVAFERAVALLPNDAQLLADYADTMVMSQDGRFEGKPMTLIQKALAADPNNMKALALAGTAELRMGNKQASLKHWNKLKTLVERDSDDYRQVEAIIAEVQDGRSPISPAAAAPVAEAPPKVAPASMPSPAMPPAKTAAGATQGTGVAVTGQVLLAPAVAAKLAAGDTLFVFARAKEGPRIPLAVLRVPVSKASEFPRAFELTDAMAMAPGMSLSAFSEVVIEARISKSGNAQLQPGDVNGLSDPVKPGATNVKVTLSKVAQ